MRIISAKKLSEALSKAQGVGLVEERFTISDCEIVLRNLRPDEYEAIIEDTKELPDLAFTNAYQRAHVCRSIVEINGVDLRDVRFVETEEDDAKTGKARTLKLELHTYLDKQVLATWSKEAIFTAYRKVGDVITIAEDQAKKGIVFRIPEEAPEDKLRRLLGELRETEEDMPFEVIARTLDEFGYSHKMTSSEALAVEDRLSKLSEVLPKESEAAPEKPAVVETQPVAAPLDPSTASGKDLQEALARRTPLNQLPVNVPSVVRTVPTASDATETKSRSATIAALEGNMADSAELAGPPNQAYQLPTRDVSNEIAELSHKALPVNAKEVSRILDQPPSGGINPRFRPPQR
jgi:hypothetical protein